MLLYFSLDGLNLFVFFVLFVCLFFWFACFFFFFVFFVKTRKITSTSLRESFAHGDAFKDQTESPEGRGNSVVECWTPDLEALSSNPHKCHAVSLNRTASAP